MYKFVKMVDKENENAVNRMVIDVKTGNSTTGIKFTPIEETEATAAFSKRKVFFQKVGIHNAAYTCAACKNDKPYKFIAGGKIYWYFGFKFYRDHEGLGADDVKALLITRKKLQDQRIKRAKTIAFAELPRLDKATRGKIPDDIKLMVWERDGGRCAKCGSQTELQYDHIIPFSLGGASTPENLQILCGGCNRQKSASVV
jgi:hypothetical protein